MWLFLATEVLLFGGLFCAYSVWRGNHPEIFQYGSQFLDTFWGGLNTCVLLTSSMTMAMAVTPLTNVTPPYDTNAALSDMRESDIQTQK